VKQKGLTVSNNFQEKYKNTEANGEEYISLVHTKNHKKFIHDACMNKETVAEVELNTIKL